MISKIFLIPGFGLTKSSCNKFLSLLIKEDIVESINSIIIPDLIDLEYGQIFNHDRLSQISDNTSIFLLHSISAPIFLPLLTKYDNNLKFILIEPNLEIQDNSKFITSLIQNKQDEKKRNSNINLLKRIYASSVNNNLMDFELYNNDSFINYLEWSLSKIKNGILTRTICSNAKSFKIIITEKQKNSYFYSKNNIDIRFYSLNSHNPMIDYPLKLTKIIRHSIDDF